MYGVSSVDSYELILKSIESDWGKFVGRLTNVMKVSIILSCVDADYSASHSYF